jgi:hypothetical protein
MFYARIRNLKRKNRANKADAYKLTRDQGEERISNIPEIAKKTFKQHISTLIAIAKSGNASVILSSYATLHDPTLDWPKRDALDNATDFQLKTLGGLTYFTPGLTLDGVLKCFLEYDEILRQIAYEENVEWVDNASLIPHEDRYFVDRVHLSKDGAKLMAENYLPALIKLIENNTEI